MAETKVFSVTGMTCDNCVHHVTEAIRAIPGVTEVNVSLEDKSATVDGEIDVAKIVAAVEEEGYEAAVRA